MCPFKDVAEDTDKKVAKLQAHAVDVKKITPVLSDSTQAAQRQHNLEMKAARKTDAAIAAEKALQQQVERVRAVVKEVDQAKLKPGSAEISYINGTAERINAKFKESPEAAGGMLAAFQQYVRLSITGSNEGKTELRDAIGYYDKGQVKKGNKAMEAAFKKIEAYEQRRYQQQLQTEAQMERMNYHNAAVKMKAEFTDSLAASGMTNEKIQQNETVRLLDRIIKDTDNFRGYLDQDFAGVRYEFSNHALAWSIALTAASRAVESNDYAAMIEQSSRFSGGTMNRFREGDVTLIRAELAGRFRHNANDFILVGEHALDQAERKYETDEKKSAADIRKDLTEGAEERITGAFRKRGEILADVDPFLKGRIGTIVANQGFYMLAIVREIKPPSQTLLEAANSDYSRILDVFCSIDDSDARNNLYNAAAWNFDHAKKASTASGNERENELSLYRTSGKDLDYNISRDKKATRAFDSLLDAANTVVSLALPVYGLALSAEGLAEQYDATGKVRTMDAALTAAGIIAPGLGRLGQAGVRGARTAEAVLGVSSLAAGTIVGGYDAYGAWKSGQEIDAVVGGFAVLHPLGHPLRTVIGLGARAAGRRAAMREMPQTRGMPVEEGGRAQEKYPVAIPKPAEEQPFKRGKIEQETKAQPVSARSAEEIPTRAARPRPAKPAEAQAQGPEVPEARAAGQPQRKAGPEEVRLAEPIPATRALKPAPEPVPKQVEPRIPFSNAELKEATSYDDRMNAGSFSSARRESAIKDFLALEPEKQERLVGAMVAGGHKDSALYLANMRGIASLEKALGMQKNSLRDAYMSENGPYEAMLKVGTEEARQGVFISPQLGLDFSLQSLLLSGDLGGQVLDLVPEGSRITGFVNREGLIGAYEVRVKLPSGEEKSFFAKKQDLQPNALGAELARNAGVPAPVTITESNGLPLSFTAPDGARISYGLMEHMEDFRGTLNIAGRDMETSALAETALKDVGSDPVMGGIYKDHQNLFWREVGRTVTALMSTGTWDNHESNLRAMMLKVPADQVEFLRSRGYTVFDTPKGPAIFRVGRIDTDAGGCFRATQNGSGGYDFSGGRYHMFEWVAREDVGRIFNEFSDTEKTTVPELADRAMPYIMEGAKQWYDEIGSSRNYQNRVERTLRNHDDKPANIARPLWPDQVSSIEAHSAGGVGGLPRLPEPFNGQKEPKIIDRYGRVLFNADDAVRVFEHFMNQAERDGNFDFAWRAINAEVKAQYAPEALRKAAGAEELQPQKPAGAAAQVKPAENAPVAGPAGPRQEGGVENADALRKEANALVQKADRLAEDYAGAIGDRKERTRIFREMNDARTKANKLLTEATGMGTRAALPPEQQAQETAGRFGRGARYTWAAIKGFGRGIIKPKGPGAASDLLGGLGIATGEGVQGAIDQVKTQMAVEKLAVEYERSRQIPKRGEPMTAPSPAVIRMWEILGEQYQQGETPAPRAVRDAANRVVSEELASAKMTAQPKHPEQLPKDVVQATRTEFEKHVVVEGADRIFQDGDMKATVPQRQFEKACDIAAAAREVAAGRKAAAEFPVDIANSVAALAAKYETNRKYGGANQRTELALALEETGNLPEFAKDAEVQKAAGRMRVIHNAELGGLKTGDELRAYAQKLEGDARTERKNARNDIGRMYADILDDSAKMLMQAADAADKALSPEAAVRSADLQPEVARQAKENGSTPVSASELEHIAGMARGSDALEQVFREKHVNGPKDREIRDIAKALELSLNRAEQQPAEYRDAVLSIKDYQRKIEEGQKKGQKYDEAELATAIARNLVDWAQYIKGRRKAKIIYRVLE